MSIAKKTGISHGEVIYGPDFANMTQKEVDTIIRRHAERI
jgi:hypothetical protein